MSLVRDESDIVTRVTLVIRADVVCDVWMLCLRPHALGLWFVSRMSLVRDETHNVTRVTRVDVVCDVVFEGAHSGCADIVWHGRMLYMMLQMLCLTCGCCV